VQLQVEGGLSNFSYSIQAATSLNPLVQWSNLGAAIADTTGQCSFIDTNARLFSQRFYRIQSP